MSETAPQKTNMIAITANTILLPGEKISYTFSYGGIFKDPDDFRRFIEAAKKDHDGEIAIVPFLGDEPSKAGTVGKIILDEITAEGNPRLLIEGVRKIRVDKIGADERNFYIAVTQPMPNAASREEKKKTRALMEELERKANEYFDTASASDATKAKLRTMIRDMVADGKGPAENAVSKAMLFLNISKLAMHEDMLPVYEMDNSAKQLEALSALVVRRIESRKALEAYKKASAKLPANTASKNEPAARNGGKILPPDPAEEEMNALEKKIREKELPPEARERAEKEFSRLKLMSPGSAEAAVIRNYIDWVLCLPWEKHDQTNDDIPLAAEILDSDHYGLEKVKHKVVKHLAVQKRRGGESGKILCLIGPPGVGKTSIARSIADASGRSYVRLALGGLNDESEIRGHRRTYIGALPGRIISALKKAGSSNPVFVLDEIDKIAQNNGFRGDPTSALLEVLDPKQNDSFSDRYLDLDYDLSKVMFICTANDISGIPAPLRDRMEIVQLSGYTEEEKFEIARRHLISHALEETGIKPAEFSIDDGALRKLIGEYTREAGVRGLERALIDICEEIAVRLETDPLAAATHHITLENLEDYAGKPKVHHQRIPETDLVGHVNGLAVTSLGGVLLPMETVTHPSSKFEVVATGQLGKVMGESIKVAETMLYAKATELRIPLDKFKNAKYHVHALDGAVPKDGPSAGVTVSTALVSLMLKEPVSRFVAMTGEISLRGDVLPIGGLAFKLEAALRGGAKKVLIPQANYDRDLHEVPDAIRNALDIVPVKTIKEVLHHALVNGPALFPESKPGNDNDSISASPAAPKSAAKPTKAASGPSM